jgi:4-hydroxybutyryl-CoA dehydratase/vinylacetyl-CoA-Delta-isomerase
MMAIKNRNDYLASLKKMRPNIYKFGELIEDVTTHPATKRTVESHARVYDGANDPELADIYTTTSTFTGEKILRWNSLMTSAEDLIANMNMKRLNYRRTGSCTGAVCCGWNGMNVMWAVTTDIDKEFGTNYHERLENWIKMVEREGLAVAGALDSPCHPFVAWYERSIPDCRGEIVQEAAHFVNVEQPEPYNDLLLAFLAAHAE